MRKRQTQDKARYSVILTQDLREPLEELAQECGYMWGEKSNVHALIRAIALKNCLLLNHSKDLPALSAVYFCMDADGKILYIGETQNLKSRWQNHQKFKSLSEVPGVAISWIECPKEKLKTIESVFIELLNPPLNRKSDTYTLVLPQETRGMLGIIAKKHKFLWGSRPSIQAFVTAVARDEFEIKRRVEPIQETLELYTSREEIEHLLASFWTLRDTGQKYVSHSIAKILLERYEIPNSVTQHLEAVLNSAETEFFKEIKIAIANKKCFALFYESASGQEYQFNIEYAEIRQIERHFYLCCWVQEQTNKGEIEALAHNMTLRLDRINESSVFPFDGKKWREGLDAIELEFKLLGGWVKNYEPKPDDIETKLTTENGILVRYVKRRVNFWHWVGRELLRYGAECVVISPSDVRSLMKSEIAKMNANYQGEIDFH